jgi:hypothetical protein
VLAADVRETSDGRNLLGARLIVETVNEGACDGDEAQAKPVVQLTGCDAVKPETCTATI